jgi:hypothetical protein
MKKIKIIATITAIAIVLSVTSYVMYAGRNLPILIDDPINTEQVNEVPEPGSIIIRPEPGSPEIKESGFNDVLAGHRLPSKPSKGDTTLGERYEEYSHSDYTYKYFVINKYNVLPYYNSEYLTSLARGETQTMSYKIALSGSIGFNASVSVVLKKVINLALAKNISGSLSGEVSFTKTLEGPPAGYSSQVYYKAMINDYGTAYVHTIDYYDTYDYNNGRTRLVEKNSSSKEYDKAVKDIKKPHAITYSKLVK